MKLRITGTRGDIKAALPLLAAVLDAQEPSNPRRDSGGDALTGRFHVDLRTVHTGHTAAEPVQAPLADIATVLTGHTRLRTQEVLQQLVELDRDQYRSWTFTDLRNALPDAAKPYKCNGRMVVSRSRVLEAMNQHQDGGVR